MCHARQPNSTRPKFLEDHVFWSYEMATHVETRHANTIVPEEFATSYRIEPAEARNLYLEAGDTRANSASAKGKKRAAIDDSADTSEAKTKAKAKKVKRN